MESKSRHSAAAEQRSESDDARRSFLKKGLIAAPLLVTLAARPAQAQEVITGSLGAYGYGIDDEGTGGGPLGASDTDGFGAL